MYIKTETYSWELKDISFLPLVTLSPIFYFEDVEMQFKLITKEDFNYELYIIVESVPVPFRFHIVYKVTPGLSGNKAVVLNRPSKKLLSYISKNDVGKEDSTIKIVLTLRGKAVVSQGIVGTLKRKRENEETEQRNTRAKNLQGSSTTDSSLCTLCLDNPRNVMFNPCHHVGACLHCTNRLEHPRCPYCNEAYEEVVQIYMC